MTIFKKVLIANRGDVTRRVIRTLRLLGIKSVAVYSKADAGLPYLEEADEVYPIGESRAQSSYLNQEVLLEVIKQSGADAVHPGYGFLSEDVTFASRIQNMGARFIGPSTQWLETMANKNTARKMMASYGMPIGSGSGIIGDDLNAIQAEGQRIGYPVLVKPAGGGGGIGMLSANNGDELVKAVQQAKSLAMRSFANDEVYLEKYFINPRHIEFQILGDSYGDVCHFFERDCSVQRRHQKVIEESPAVGIHSDELASLAQTITNVLKDMKYDNIGTVEMLRGNDGSYSFLEMNTRLQVEHAVTEEVTGIDLVAAQIRSAAGEKLSSILNPSQLKQQGHAIEVRVYAEDPHTFFPSPGKLNEFRPPVGEGIRVETGYAEGTMVTPFYDPMIAKVIVHAETREKAINQLIDALKTFAISGVKTNIPFLINTLSSEAFQSGAIHTGLVTDLLASAK